jgi:hypothetical protein
MGAVLLDLLSEWDIPSVEPVPRGVFLFTLFIIGFGHLFARDTLIGKAKDLITGFKKEEKPKE